MFDVWYFILTFTTHLLVRPTFSLLPSFQFNLIQTNCTPTVIFILVLFTEILSKQSTDEQDKDRKRKLSFCLDSAITDKDLSRPAYTQEEVILSLKLWHCGCTCLLYVLMKANLKIIGNVHSPNFFFFPFWFREKFVICFWVFVALVWKKQSKRTSACPPQKNHRNHHLNWQDKRKQKKKAVTVWKPLFSLGLSFISGVGELVPWL